MEKPKYPYSLFLAIARFRNGFARNLGVSAARKEEIYLDIAQAVTLTDTSYWLQVLFAAGIATLGLVLNSPAVIIGAMLISPLMGSILANGLALAAGDVVLVLRAIVNLILSCSLAVGFAVLLVSILPFKEMTDEILARTQPNLLDLGVALFSGAVGAVAISKEVKGVATSIPGVSIAVALMPPLCVVGYGIGIAISANATTGLRVASGGLLLFFTNFVAITFTAMLVFLALNVNTKAIEQRVIEWRNSDRESIQWQRVLDKLPASRRLKRIGSLPGRLLLILAVILLTSIPLSQSLGQLRNEIVYKQQESHQRNTATEVWQNNLANLSDGQAKSYIRQLVLKEQGGQLLVQLQVFSNQIYTEAEKENYRRLLSEKLSRPVESIALNLVEIPTASNDLVRKDTEEQLPNAPTIPEIQAELLKAIALNLESLKLPAPAQLVSYAASTSPEVALKIQIFYLSTRDMGADGEAIIGEAIRTSLQSPKAQVVLERISPLLTTLQFEAKQTKLQPDQTQSLDAIAKLLQQYPKLGLDITVNQAPSEKLADAQIRSQAIVVYLQTKGEIPSDRLTTKTVIEEPAIVQLKMIVKPE